MIEKPNLSDESIMTCLRRSVPAAALAFLPLGNDASSWVYRVYLESGDSLFLKVRRGAPYLPGLLAPHYLRSHGFLEVVAPLPFAPPAASDSELWAQTSGTAGDDYALVLYPFIEGPSAMDAGMPAQGWTELGRLLRRIHSLTPPTQLLEALPVERFVPPWGAMLRAVDERARLGPQENPEQSALAEFWQAKRGEICDILAHCEALGRELCAAPPDFRLCHADIHTANILLPPAGGLAVVDWDCVVLAPKERDLMFVIANQSGGAPDALAEQDLFVSAYFQGAADWCSQVDWQAIAYYRHEWVVQELGDYGQRVFFDPLAGLSTRQDAVDGVKALFDPGDVVEAAHQSIHGKP